MVSRTGFAETQRHRDTDELSSFAGSGIVSSLTDLARGGIVAAGTL
ncbi:MAG: hypothetical protein O3C40_04335 [Planctomycetota bacterium]|nr:hypothetical protein [Planctomycetota bacterium]